MACNNESIKQSAWMKVASSLLGGIFLVSLGFGAPYQVSSFNHSAHHQFHKYSKQNKFKQARSNPLSMGPGESAVGLLSGPL